MVPLTSLVPPINTWVGCVVRVACHVLPKYTAQPVITSDPLKTGLAPLPYAPNVIGCPAAPEDGTVNCSRQVQPLLNRMESPGLKLETLTLLMVFHAVVVLVPAP